MKPYITPTLTDLLKDFKNEIFSTLNSIQIGRIIEFDPNVKTAKVQLMFTRKMDDGTLEYPPLLDCPCLGNTFTQPIDVGDYCIVLLADRNIDAWFEKGEKTTPRNNRMHSLSDGVILMGLNNLIDKVKYDDGVYDTKNAVTHYEDGTIRVGEGIKFDSRKEINSRSTDDTNFISEKKFTTTSDHDTDITSKQKINTSSDKDTNIKSKTKINLDATNEITETTSTITRKATTQTEIITGNDTKTVGGTSDEVVVGNKSVTAHSITETSATNGSISFNSGNSSLGMSNSGLIANVEVSNDKKTTVNIGSDFKVSPANGGMLNVGNTINIKSNLGAELELTNNAKLTNDTDGKLLLDRDGTTSRFIGESRYAHIYIFAGDGITPSYPARFLLENRISESGAYQFAEIRGDTTNIRGLNAVNIRATADSTTKIELSKEAKITITNPTTEIELTDKIKIRNSTRSLWFILNNICTAIDGLGGNTRDIRTNINQLFVTESS